MREKGRALGVQRGWRESAARVCHTTGGMCDVGVGVLQVELWLSVLGAPAGASRATAWGLEGRGSGGECVCVGGGSGARRRRGM